MDSETIKRRRSSTVSASGSQRTPESAPGMPRLFPAAAAPAAPSAPGTPATSGDSGIGATPKFCDCACAPTPPSTSANVVAKPSATTTPAVMSCTVNATPPTLRWAIVVNSPWGGNVRGSSTATSCAPGCIASAAASSNASVEGTWSASTENAVRPSGKFTRVPGSPAAPALGRAFVQ